MEKDLITIREMCSQFDVTARTLRFYESKELLSPQREGQKRLYSRRDRARLTLILRGKRFGFSLECIRQLLDLYAMGDQNLPQMERTFDFAQRRLAAMEQQRDELVETIEDLKKHMDWGRELITQTRLKETG